MPLAAHVPVERSVLPPGDAGVDQTVQRMVQVAYGKYGAKSARIRDLAIQIVKNARVREKDYYGEINAIFKWVRDKVRYVKDPVGQETISQPEYMVFPENGHRPPMAGDCDDKVVLTMALLGSLGLTAYPVVCGTTANGPYSHVYLHAVVPPGKGRKAGQVIPLDPIMKWPAGKEASPPTVKRKKTYPQYAGGQGVNGMGRYQEFMPGMGAYNEFMPGMGNGDMLPGMGDHNEFMPGMGGYTVGPSYLDTENAQAERLLSSGSAGGTRQVMASKSGMINRNGHLQTTTKARAVATGVDGMLGAPLMAEVEPVTGNQPPATDLYGRVQDNPRFLPRVQDAGASQTGPLGPIYARAAGQETHALKSVKAYEVPTLARADEARGARGTRKVVTIGNRDRTSSLKSLAQRGAEIDGLGAYISELAGGVGYAFDDAGDDLVVESAVVSWWADFKRDLAKAQAKVLRKYGGRAEADQANAIAARARKVATEAKRVESAAANSPRKRQLAREVREVLAQDDRAHKTAQSVEGLGDLQQPAQYRDGLRQLQMMQVERKNLKERIKALRKRLQLYRRKGREASTTPRMLYQGAVSDVTIPGRKRRQRMVVPARPQPVNGMAGITDTLSKPSVYVPLALVGGYALYRIAK